jgi:hypothetical protein
MIDPFSLCTLIYLGVVAVVFVAVTLNELYSWFKDRSAIKAGNKDIVAFTLAQRIDGKEYVEVPGVFSGSHRTQIVQGFYDEKTKKVLEGRVMKSNKATEPTVAEMHKNGAGVVVYN